MDYREEYLKLKHLIMDEDKQYGSGLLNPLFINELSNLSFVIGDNILGDDVHAIILSLMEEFNKIAAMDLKHNLELSQYYIVEKNLMNHESLSQCDNCEIVLRYVDTTICVRNSHIGKEGDTYYHVENNRQKNGVKCSISRGLVRFYIKQKYGDVFKYTKIRVVRIQMVETLRPFIDVFYQNNDEINNLEEAANIAICKGQSYAISSIALKGNLQSNLPDDIMCVTKTINNIINETKKASAKSQLNRINNQRMLSKVPNQYAVNAANTIAKTIMKTNAANANNITTILVPGNEPLLLQINSSLHIIPAIIDKKRTFVRDSAVKSGTQNTLNSKTINNRASLAIDANLAVIPTHQIINDKNIEITQPSKKSSTSLSNKLSIIAINIGNKTEDVASTVVNKIEDVGGKIMDIFKKKQNAEQTDPFSSKVLNMSKQSNTTVVPVSKNLSIMTNLPNKYAVSEIPVPENDDTDLLFANTIKGSDVSQQTSSKKFEDKIMRAHRNTPISLDHSTLAVRTVKNGNDSTRRAQQMNKTNQINNRSLDNLLNKNYVNQNIGSDVSFTTNNKTIVPSVTKLPLQQTTNITIEPTDNNKNRFSKLIENLELSDLSENPKPIGQSDYNR
jgi:hypothetical protein